MGGESGCGSRQERVRWGPEAGEGRGEGGPVGCGPPGRWGHHWLPVLFLACSDSLILCDGHALP